MTLSTRRKIGMSRTDSERTSANVPDLLYYDFGPDVVAFSTRRQGGVSEGNYASFNINSHCGDNPLHVAANRQSLCQVLGIGTDRLVIPHQTHSTRVMYADESLLQLPAILRATMLEGVDALVTDVRGACIGVSTADCIPILIHDPVHGVAAAVHAGWRGTVGRIVVETLALMHREFQTCVTDVRAVIGPGISVEAFEVGDEVYETFVSAGFPMDKLARKKPSIRNVSEVCWYIDLWEANRMQLVSRGVPEEQIYVSGICTYEHVDEFFSARRQGINSGRIFSGIMLK